MSIYKFQDHIINTLPNLSNVKTKEDIYDRNSFASFVGIDLETDPVPDSTTLELLRNSLQNLSKIKFENHISWNFMYKSYDTV